MKKLSPNRVMKLFKYWPPFFISGISVKEFDLDKGYVVSQMKLSKWNSNYFGTHYGGSLYSMCDPFYVFILSHKLGRDYYIWDFKAEIDFLKATKNLIYAKFSIDEEQMQKIKRAAATGKKILPDFSSEIIDSTNGDVIARVKKVIYIKKKRV